jgi:hypothetical protein
MLRKLATALLLALTLGSIFSALPGCAALGVPTPQSAEERIVVTMSTVTGVREATLTLLAAKKITAEDAQNVQRQADNVRAGVVIAQSMLAADPAGADAKIQQTRAMLIALQAYLATKEKN